MEYDANHGGPPVDDDQQSIGGSEDFHIANANLDEAHQVRRVTRKSARAMS